MSNRYISNKKKLYISLIITGIYFTISCILNYRWFSGLNDVLPWPVSALIIVGIALCPGILCCMMVTGILLDKPRNHAMKSELPDITVLIAARNEGNDIYETLQFLNKQKYKGKVFTYVIDNCSTDDTKDEVLQARDDFKNLNIEYMFCGEPGKFNALNAGLQRANTQYTVTLDADTILYGNSLNHLVNTMVAEDNGKKVAAVVGAVLVRNSRTNLLTKLQEWDYFLSITGIKRSQGLFQSTLVAQGAYSIYNTQLLKELGGWSDTIGEDIVLSWDFLANGWNIYYDPRAVAFTMVPTTLNGFAKQRSRWARGMVEGLRKRPFWSYPTLQSKILIGEDLLLFVIDFSIVFIWIPGVIMACFGNYLIVGPLTLLLLPLTITMFAILYSKEKHTVFDEIGLKIRKNAFGFIVFLLFYQMIMAPISIFGYMQEFFRAKRAWK